MEGEREKEEEEEEEEEEEDGPKNGEGREEATSWVAGDRLLFILLSPALRALLRHPFASPPSSFLFLFVVPLLFPFSPPVDFFFLTSVLNFRQFL